MVPLILGNPHIAPLVFLFFRHFTATAARSLARTPFRIARIVWVAVKELELSYHNGTI